MLDRKQLLQTVEAEDARFNEIWDEYKDVPKEEPKVDSQPVLINAKKALKPIPILKRVGKPQRKVAITTIITENQSVVSTLSASTFHSNSSPLSVMSFLVDSTIDREVSDVTYLKLEKRRSSENSLGGGAGIFLNLYESMPVEKAFKMVSCISEEDVLQNQVDIRHLCTEVDGTDEDNVESIKQEVTQTDSNEGNSVLGDYILEQALNMSSCANVLQTQTCISPLFAKGSAKAGKTAEPSNKDNTQTDSNQANLVDGSSHDGVPPLCIRKPVAFKTFFNNSKPFAKFPDFLASTASQFHSSMLSFDDCSEASIYFVSDAKLDSVEDTHTDAADVALDVSAVALEEQRLTQRNLLDSLRAIEPQGVTASEKTPQDKPLVDCVEEVSLTEGLGLALPPTSPQHAPQTIKYEDFDEAILETIEVDLSGTVVLDEVDLSDGSISSEFSASRRDVYISYRIEEDHHRQSEDNMSLSQLQDCDTSKTSVLIKKQQSGLKSFLTPRWGKKVTHIPGIKDKNHAGILFSGISEKNYVRKSIPRGVNSRKSICHSPSGATVDTATIATLSIAGDPVNPGSLPFLLR